MKRDGPSARWNREHGGVSRRRKAGYPGKISHPNRWRAWIHALDLFLSAGGPLRRPYPCRWGPDYRDGENAPEHWHIGQKPAQS
jgi:hypothetical protein